MCERVCNACVGCWCLSYSACPLQRPKSLHSFAIASLISSPCMKCTCHLWTSAGAKKAVIPVWPALRQGSSMAGFPRCVAGQQAACVSVLLRFHKGSREQEDKWVWMCWKHWQSFLLSSQCWVAWLRWIQGVRRCIFIQWTLVEEWMFEAGLLEAFSSLLFLCHLFFLKAMKLSSKICSFTKYWELNCSRKLPWQKICYMNDFLWITLKYKWGLDLCCASVYKRLWPFRKNKMCMHQSCSNIYNNYFLGRAVLIRSSNHCLCLHTDHVWGR